MSRHVSTRVIQISALNLYGADGGDRALRMEVFGKHFPDEPFVDYSPYSGFVDDEEDLSVEQLLDPDGVLVGGAGESVDVSIAQDSTLPPS